MQADSGRAGVAYDKEFIVCSLDLLSGLAEGLGASIESLVQIWSWVSLFCWDYLQIFITCREISIC
jgi:hypothetical protein